MARDKTIEKEIEDLDDIDALLKQTKPNVSSAEIPAGTYSCKIDEAVLTKAKTSGKLMLKYVLKVTDGEYKGRAVFKNAMLEPETSREYTLGDFIKLGYDKPDSKAELLSTLEEMVGSLVEVRVVQNSEGNVNKYFNKALHDVDTSDVEENIEDKKPAKSKKKSQADEDTLSLAILEFAEDDVSELLKPKIERLATKCKLDPDEFNEDYKGLLEAMCARKEINGTFESAKEVYNAIIETLS